MDVLHGTTLKATAFVGENYLLQYLSTDGIGKAGHKIGAIEK